MEENLSSSYGVESGYAMIENKKFGLIENISKALSKVRELENQTEIVIQVSG